MARSKARKAKNKRASAKKKPQPAQDYRFWWALGIALLTALVFSSALENQFVDWDDYTYVVENPYVLQPSWENIAELWRRPVSLNYHPITMTSLALNAKWLGTEAWGFIAVNILFHALNSFLVFLLVWRWSKGQLWASAFAALLFGLHPMHVESVVWVSERKDVLYVFFFLLGLLSYERYWREKAQKWLRLCFGLFLLACLSKAMAVVFPVVLLLVDYWHGRDFKQKKLYIEKIPFFIGSIFFGLMALSVQGGGDFGGLLTITENSRAIADADAFSLLQRLQFASYGFVQYLVLFLFPTGLSVYYPYPNLEDVYTGWFVVSPFLFLLLWIAVFWARKRSKLPLFGFGFYFVTVALVLQFLSVGVVVMANRYTYLPYLGLAFLAGMAISMLLKKSPQLLPLYWGGLVGLVLFWGLLSRERIAVWQNSDTLWSSVIEQYPEEEHAYSLRGNYYGKLSAQTNNTQERQILLQKALADFNQAIALGSQRYQVYEGMGNVYGSMGQPQQALEAYEKAVQLAPDKGSLYLNRAIAHSMLGNRAAAFADYDKALQILPQKAGFIAMNRGGLHLGAGDYQQALADFNIAVQQLPNNPRSWFNRGNTYLQMGQRDAAKRDYEQALRVDPNFTPAQQQLQQLQ